MTLAQLADDFLLDFDGPDAIFRCKFCQEVIVKFSLGDVRPVTALIVAHFAFHHARGEGRYGTLSAVR